MARVMRVWPRLSALKRDHGIGAALRLVIRRFVRFAVAPVSLLKRSIDQFQDFAAMVMILLMPNVFMRHGVLFIGYLEATLGLGESLRALVHSIARTNLPFALYPFNLGVETRFVAAFMKDRYDLRHCYRVNVVEMAADQLPGMFSKLENWRTKHSYNILRTYWELPQAPSAWASTLKGIHELWVPNDFVYNAFREIFHGPIMVIPPCVEIETEVNFGRKELGMDHDRFYFIFSFDYFSSPFRKNPLSVLRAFRNAFPDPTGRVGLLIKSTSAAGRYPDIKSAILEAAVHDQRIKVIDRTLSRDEMLSLIRQSDCYISLHRSEGFGLGMAEAMAFGKPVIGTNFSGSVDFLSDRTGFPVSYTLRPLQPGEYIYSEGQSWAEPDEAVAVEAMRQVFYDRQLRQDRAAAGKAFVEARYGRENVGRIAARRLEDILATEHRAWFGLHRRAAQQSALANLIEEAPP